jgi:hypothetical protein
MGDPGTSLDLTAPPAACATYFPIFEGRTATVLHEFSYLPSADGNYEEGHINIAGIRAQSAQMVTDELTSVTQSGFAGCAEASAVRRFHETESGTIDNVSATKIDLGISGPNVVWRAAVANHTPDGASHTMYMDVAYLGAGDLAVKVRIASCGCRPLGADAAPLMTGEVTALQWIAYELATGAKRV